MSRHLLAVAALTASTFALACSGTTDGDLRGENEEALSGSSASVNVSSVVGTEWSKTVTAAERWFGGNQCDLGPMANDADDYTAATKEPVARLSIRNPSNAPVAVAVYAEPGDALVGKNGRVYSANTAIFVDAYSSSPSTAKLATHCIALSSAYSDESSPVRADLDWAAFLPQSEWSKQHVQQSALVIPAGGSVVLLAGSYHSGYYDGGAVRFRLRTVTP